YLTIWVANFVAASQFGRSVYANTMAWLGPLGFGICLIIWTVALWNLDPVPSLERLADGAMGGGGQRQEVQLRRFGTYVTRLLWK
ncbi:MAG: hypothetical protein ACM3NO_04820, partial [Deltaproteobacteria bacterium]